jgi:hypothetical protein
LMLSAGAGMVAKLSGPFVDCLRSDGAEFVGIR